MPILETEPDHEEYELPKPELSIHVRNVGGSPADLEAILIEAESLHPLYEHDEHGPEFIGVEFVRSICGEFAIEKADRLEGPNGPLSPGVDAAYGLPGHGIYHETEVQRYRLGVRTRDGKEFWEPERLPKAQQPSA